MRYMSLPKKRPEYRGDRSHDEFLVKLGEGLGSKDLFYKKVRDAAAKLFQVEETGLDEALQVVNEELGGMQSWFDGKCRTKIIEI